MTKRAVGFDLDYTLAVPVRDRKQLLEDASASVDGPIISREAYLDAHRRNLTSETRAPIFEDLLEGDDVAGRARELAREYREAVNRALVPVMGVEAMLEELRREYRIGLLTNGPTVAQRGKLEKLGWQDTFDWVTITGDLTAGKPDRIAFEALLNGLDVDADDAVYVGDEIEADIVGATAAGLAAVQVIYPGGPARDPRADAHVDRSVMARRLPDIVAEL